MMRFIFKMKNEEEEKGKEEEEENQAGYVKQFLDCVFITLLKMAAFFFFITRRTDECTELLCLSQSWRSVSLQSCTINHTNSLCVT